MELSADKIILLISQLSNNINSGNLPGIKKNRDVLLDSNVNEALKVVLHDIYVEVKVGDWLKARREVALLDQEVYYRISDGYGIMN